MSRQQLESFKKTKKPRTDCDSEGATSGATEEILTPDSQVDLEDQSEESTSPNELIEFEVIQDPYQPRSKQLFPKRKFGQKNPVYRSFQPSWFDNDLWGKWLNWETRNNRAYCFMCRNVHALKQLTLSKSKETAFISTGFNNWKDATRVFEQHRKSACHMEAVMKWNQHVKGTSINVQLQ